MMKSKVALLTLVSLAMGAIVKEKYVPYLNPKKLKEKKQREEIERKQRQGLKEYHYGEKIIWARNQKNADRKAKNKQLC